MHVLTGEVIMPWVPFRLITEEFNSAKREVQDGYAKAW
jgi:hypothetical protein